VNWLSTRKPAKRLIFQWTTFKGLAAILLFLIAVTFIEYLIVIYAINLGVKDKTLLWYGFQFPGIDLIIAVAISPLFHLVPIAVMIALACSWTYLTRYVAVKPPERWKGKVRPLAKQGKEQGLEDVKRLTSKIGDFFGRVKSGLLRIRGIAYLWQKIHFARATIKSALTVVLVFTAVVLLVSYLTYPQLIYLTVSNAYQSNPSLLGFARTLGNFGKNIVEVLVPIGWTCSVVNSALLSIAPGLRNFVLGLGGLMKPLVELDDIGKYLVFQNVSTWISGLTALFYGGHKRKSYRHKKGRRR
jgi:hypothetical protein